MSRFFCEAQLVMGQDISLDEETTRHVVQVLRMQAGATIELTDGRGNVAVAEIKTAEKKKCSVVIRAVIQYAMPEPQLHLAVAFTKNTSRNEWLLEKITELGVRSIIPLMVQRSERERIKHDRWRSILVSAMLQSQQSWLPNLTEALSLDKLISQYRTISQKLIAHCIDNISRQPLAEATEPAKETLILIGPEGDFTADEVQQCVGAGFAGIVMGDTRLRTETAAMAACVYFNMVNYEKN